MKLRCTVCIRVFLLQEEMYLSDSRLGFILSCLSGTYRNGAHSGSRRFVVTFLTFARDPRDPRGGFCERRNLRRPAATPRSRAAPLLEEDRRFTVLREWPSPWRCNWTRRKLISRSINRPCVEFYRVPGVHRLSRCVRSRPVRIVASLHLMS